MAQYVDFAYYTDTVNGFGGTAILEPDFNKYLRKATIFIDNITFDRLTGESVIISDNVKNCLCEMMELNFELDQKETETDGKLISSETTGNTTQTYAISDIEKNTVDRTQINKVKYYNIAKEYLSNTGLLYRGL